MKFFLLAALESARWWCAFGLKAKLVAPALSVGATSFNCAVLKNVREARTGARGARGRVREEPGRAIDFVCASALAPCFSSATAAALPPNGSVAKASLCLLRLASIYYGFQ